MFTCLDCHLLPLLEKFQNVCSEVILSTDFRGASQKAGVKSLRKEFPFTFKSFSFPLLHGCCPEGEQELWKGQKEWKGVRGRETEKSGPILPKFQAEEELGS